MQIVSSKPMPIAQGETTSTAVDCYSLQLVGLITDADWTAQDLSLLVSLDGGNDYVPFRAIDGAAWKLAALAKSVYVPLDLHLTPGIRYVKAVSGAAQASATVVTAVLRDVA